MEKIVEIRNKILNLSDKIINGDNKENILKELEENLKEVKSLEYDNCSVELFELLVDEELILDLLINKGNLDTETANELKDNKTLYLEGKYTCKKLIDNLLG